MNRLFLFIIICGTMLNSLAQQIQLKGIVTVQNSKTNTGQIQYVKNAEVEHINDKNAKTKDVTGDDGKFMLNIKGVAINTQIQIAVNLYGNYSDYMVVNEKEIKDITLGRTASVKIYICKKDELEQRRADMVGINMKKYKDQIKQLNKELEELKDKYDYDNPRYKVLENQIDSLSKAEKAMYLLVKEWAENLTTINLDESNEKYVKAFYCFAQGHLDSINFYLPEDYLKQQQEQLVKQQAEGMQKIEAGKLLTNVGQQEVEAAKAGFADLAKSWMLKAKAAVLENNYDRAISHYEEAINTDPSNVANIWEFANYLYSMQEYIKAEKYYLQCLEIYRTLERENTKAYLPYVAKSLNNLGNLHNAAKQYPKALEEHEDALKIRRKLANENTKAYSPDLAMTLNNLAVLHRITNEYSKALEEYKEALEICRRLANENSQYLPDVATILNNLANLHKDLKEYSKASEEYEEALKIFQKLADENSKDYLPDLAMTFFNLAILHKITNEYPKALKEYENALKIYQKLANDNPKAYSSYLIMILNNLSSTYGQLKDYPATIKYTNIYIDLLKQNNNKSALVSNYGNLSWYYLFVKEYVQSEQSARQALELDNTSLVAKTNLAHALLFQNRFSEAEKIYKELSQNSSNIQSILSDFDELETDFVIPEVCKNNVDKIRKMLKK